MVKLRNLSEARRRTGEACEVGVENAEVVSWFVVWRLGSFGCTRRGGELVLDSWWTSKLTKTEVVAGLDELGGCCGWSWISLVAARVWLSNSWGFRLAVNEPAQR